MKGKVVGDDFKALRPTTRSGVWKVEKTELDAGRVVFFEGAIGSKAPVSTLRTHYHRLNRRLVARSVEIDGKDGIVVWVDGEYKR